MLNADCGFVVPMPTRPWLIVRVEPPTEKALPCTVSVDWITTLSPGAVSRTWVPSSVQPEAPEATWLST